MAASQPFFFSFLYVLCHYADMPWQNFFKLDTGTGYHIIHVHVILICNPIQDGRQSAILFSIFHVLCHYADMPWHNFFKLDTRTGYHIINVHVILFRDPIQDGCQSAISFKFFSGLMPLHIHALMKFFQTWQNDRVAPHTCAPHFVLQSNPRWPPVGHFVLIFFLSSAITDTCLDNFGTYTC